MDCVAPGSLCFDVGAHVGNRMRCWRRLGARVVAIEPQADFVRVLRWLYGNDAQVEIVPLAVGRAAGSAELLVSERTPTVTTLSQPWVEAVQRDPKFANVSWSRGRRVDVVTLDSLIARYGEPAFVKVDVYPTVDGRTLEGLTAADFEILEDGTPQHVDAPLTRRNRDLTEVTVPALFYYSSDRGSSEVSMLLGLVNWRSTAAAWRFRLFWFIAFGAGDTDQLLEVGP